VRRMRQAQDGELRIAYSLRGTLHRRRPWLTLIQGLGFDSHGWGPVVGRLENHFRLVLVDNRGSGHSDPAPQSLKIADMARDVVTVLDHAGIGRSSVLGASLGGMVAQELAVQHPSGSAISSLPAPHLAGLSPFPCRLVLPSWRRRFVPCLPRGRCGGLCRTPYPRRR
jgi:pimeloyl-ACP methyl ester carboxylesterase